MSVQKTYVIPESEYTISAVRSSGPGGQHVNKVSTAIVLRFDIKASTLPDEIKQRLLESKDKRITDEGVVILKASTYRSQQRNKEEAINKLHVLIERASRTRKKRKPTKPSKAAIAKRLAEKMRKSELKAQRKKPDDAGADG